MFGRVDPDEPVIRGRDQSSRPIEVHPIAGRSVLGFAGQWMVATADIEDPSHSAHLTKPQFTVSLA